jgi:hypothetical protein
MTEQSMIDRSKVSCRAVSSVAAEVLRVMFKQRPISLLGLVLGKGNNTQSWIGHLEQDQRLELYSMKKRRPSLGPTISSALGTRLRLGAVVGEEFGSMLMTPGVALGTLLFLGLELC